MEGLIPLALVALTSLGAWLLGTRRLGLGESGLRAAGRHMLEWIGLTLVFLAANLTVGVAGVLLARALSERFVSVYLVNDQILLVLSALQAFVFAWWRAGASR